MHRLMRLAHVVIVAAAAAFVVPAASGGVTVTLGEWRDSKMGDYPKHTDHPTTTIEWRMGTGKVEFGLRYHVCIDKSHAPDVGTPEGYLGMFAPSSGNWYHNGFLYVMVNGRDIGLSRVKAIRVAETGDRGVVDMIFPIPEGEARVSFLALPGDDKLFVRVGLLPNPKTEIKSFSIRAVCYPSGYIKDGDRWITSAVRSVEQGKTVDLETEKEWWVAYYDKQFDPGKGSSGEGNAAMLFLPEQIEKGKVEVGTYGISTALDARPGVKELRFIFWDFKGQANERTLGFLRGAANRSREELTQISFANRYLDPAVWAKTMGEVGSLAASLPDRSEQEKRVAPLRQEIERLSTTIQAATSAGQAPASADEERLLDDLKKLEELRWDLRFKALFVE